MLPGTVKPRLPVECPKFLSDFDYILILTDFHGSPQHQIAQKSAQLETRSYVRTDEGDDAGNGRSSRLGERA